MLFGLYPSSGVYTLGGPGADFADFTEAGSILSSCGINANTIVNVAPGTYMEEFILDHVPGTGPGATLTINGGDTSLVYLNGASGPTVYLNGTDYTTIKNMTISAAGTTDAYGVQLRDTATGNTIDSCRIMMNLGTNSSDCIGVSASNSTTSSFTEGQNALRNVGNRFMDNWIDQAEDYGFYMDDQDSMVILRNRVTGLRNTNADGNFALDGTPSSRAKVINNMISSRTDYGANFDGFEMTDVGHNTFGNTSTFAGGMRINDFTGLDIQNNIFYSDGGFAFESDEAVDTLVNIVDYNNYYATDTMKYIDDGFTVYFSVAAW